MVRLCRCARRAWRRRVGRCGRGTEGACSSHSLPSGTITRTKARRGPSACRCGRAEPVRAHTQTHTCTRARTHTHTHTHTQTHLGACSSRSPPPAVPNTCGITAQYGRVRCGSLGIGIRRGAHSLIPLFSGSVGGTLDHADWDTVPCGTPRPYWHAARSGLYSRTVLSLAGFRRLRSSSGGCVAWPCCVQQLVERTGGRDPVGRFPADRCGRRYSAATHAVW